MTLAVKVVADGNWRTETSKILTNIKDNDRVGIFNVTIHMVYDSNKEILQANVSILLLPL